MMLPTALQASCVEPGLWIIAGYEVRRTRRNGMASWRVKRDGVLHYQGDSLAQVRSWIARHR